MSDNAGCIPGAALLGLVMLIATVVIGAPIVTGEGLSWDSSAVISRHDARLEMERVRQAAETARVREREATAREMSANMMVTLQWLAVVGGIVGALAVAGWATARSVEAWAARPHRPVAAPQQIEVRMSFEQARLLAQPHLLAMPDARLEWVEEDDITGWAVVNDRLQIVRPLQLTDSLHRS